MKYSTNLIQLLKEWEGCILQVYPDSGKELTIGIGHLLTKSERSSGKIRVGDYFISYANGISEDQARRLLVQDLVRPDWAVSVNVHVLLTQNQYNALVSFVFNLGVSAFENSTLLRVLNNGRFDQVPVQLRRWIHDNGKVVQGLINRREKEIALWEGK